MINRIGEQLGSYLLLQKDPKQRFPSVSAFASAFQQACQASLVLTPLSGEKTRILERPKKSLLSRHTVVLGVGGVVGLTGVSAGLVWLLSPRDPVQTHASQTHPPATWSDKNYQYKKAITISYEKVSGGSDLKNFPVSL